MFETLLVVFLALILCVWYCFEKAYKYLLNTYFVKNDIVVYDVWLKHFIQVVSEDNTFMNYGLWDVDHTILLDANKHLVNYLFEKATLPEKNANILDVGCGYGTQDVEWAKRMDPSNKITAIDISETQIQYAKETWKEYPSLEFKQGDAMKIATQFSADSFDTIFSVESAFHYADRHKFFSGVYKVCKPNGTFVISDIVLADSYKPSLLTNLFLGLFSDFLQMPQINFITATQWKQMLQTTAFDLVEFHDITAQTFVPYYAHFFQTYVKKKGCPKVVANTLDSLFYSIQPFSYVVAVCKKTSKSLEKEESRLKPR